MHAISLRQPAVDAIFAGFKTVEVTGRKLGHRGDLLIHCSRAYGRLERERLAGLRERGIELGDPLPSAFGALVGLVQVVDCRPATPDDWEAALTAPKHDDRTYWAWQLAEPDRFPEPIPYRGHLYVFEVPERDLTAAALAPR